MLSKILSRRTFATSSRLLAAQSRFNSSNGGRSSAPLLLALPLAAAAYGLVRSEEEEALCNSASTADRIRGNYENKIRFFSSPEKIFETFATEKDENNQVLMTYGDMLRALTPYNYGEIKETKEYMEKHSQRINKLLHLADADNNGTISFTEFFFFITILQLPDAIIEKDFKRFEGQKMNAEQFSQRLTYHRRQTKFGKKQAGSVVLDGRNVKASDEDFLETNKLITAKLFED